METRTATPSQGIRVLALTMLLGSLGTSIANIALPTLAKSFTAPFAQVQAVIVAYLAALTLGSLVAGRLGDRFGLRVALVAGLWLFLAGSLLCAVAPGLPTLIAARLVQGAGAAGLITLSMALIRQTAAPTGLGRAMGLLGTSSALGTALGAPLGGLILPLMGWRGIFWVLLPVATLAIALVLTTLPRDARTARPAAPGLLTVLDRAILPGLTLQFEIKRPIVVERCLYEFGLFLLDHGIRRRVYQLNVSPRDKRSHNSPLGPMYGPHEHVGNQVLPIVDSDVACGLPGVAFAFYCRRINLTFAGSFKSPL